MNNQLSSALHSCPSVFNNWQRSCVVTRYALGSRGAAGVQAAERPASPGGPGKPTPHRFKVEQKGNRSCLAEEEPPRLRGGRKTSRANEALRRHLWEGRPTEVRENKLPLLRESDIWGCVYKNRTHRGPEESDGLGWDWNHYLSNKCPSRRLHPWPGPKCTPGSGSLNSAKFSALFLRSLLDDPGYFLMLVNISQMTGVH